MSAVQKWTGVNVVVGVVGHYARNYEGGGVWYVVEGLRRSPPPFLYLVYSISVRGDISGVLRNIDRAT